MRIGSGHAPRQDRLHHGPGHGLYDTIRELVIAGMDVARLNLSHGTHADHRRMYDNVRRAGDDVGRGGILADL